LAAEAVYKDKSPAWKTGRKKEDARMKRGLALFLAALLTALTLTACGGGGDVSSGTNQASGESGGDFKNESAGFDTAAPADWGFDSDAPAEAAAEESRTEADSRLANAKMVYTANVEAESKDFDACTAGIEKLTAELGGYMEYASVDSYGSGYRRGNYTVRVPAAKFDFFLKSVGELGNIVSQDKSADNISETYYDIESRLTTQKTKMERLQALLARAENMEDVITIESAIADTELAIEQLTGSLRHYDSLVDFATIRLGIQEVSRLTDVEVTPPTFFDRLSGAFVGGLQSFGDFLQDLAVYLAYNWTWIVVLILLVLLFVRISRRRRARMMESFGQPRPEKRGFFRRKKREEQKNPDDKQPKD